MFEGFERARINTDGAEINLLKGGSGPPLLLLHGYPQTHVMWHKIAGRLAEDFSVVITDLRGYGDSSKPPGGDDHEGYSKRAMADDQVQVMENLGFEKFFVAGHDRGGRVTHRMALDYPEKVLKASVLDIVPTHKIFTTVNQMVASGYYHWFFLIQPGGLPERLIGNDPEFYIRQKLGHWSASTDGFTDEAMAEYIRCYSMPETIHASCEDYRAAASIDMVHDEADMDNPVGCPLLVLWGKNGLMDKSYDVLETWHERARDARGEAINCGHFLAEENPGDTVRALLEFFKQ
ncbi:MAG: alpha/beta hydrolase [Rhodospirillaceae bacterium]|jgi:haloacetate dehalogenase|nr:alpha/beta hydrolase [Rhodospirillaceae bacterium]MBT5245853.1 alpha/beta hydrolase [Rhodospirillaceae bacterium]MBT5561251.1 alpha/beta hydrolase [Rhodospirillaceae bacterium]MBT6240498.1 alpha/beta hydrolase [Rhodospirillaceae bacterium]MBT7136342.1 alpha/beta hydrolase [Rhodospirillaceae bacterium]